MVYLASGLPLYVVKKREGGEKRRERRKIIERKKRQRERKDIERKKRLYYIEIERGKVGALQAKITTHY